MKNTQQTSSSKEVKTTEQKFIDKMIYSAKLSAEIVAPQVSQTLENVQNLFLQELDSRLKYGKNFNIKSQQSRNMFEISFSAFASMYRNDLFKKNPELKEKWNNTKHLYQERFNEISKEQIKLIQQHI